MRKLLLLCFFLLDGVATFASSPVPVNAQPVPPVNGLTLSEAFSLALKRSETVAIQGESVLQAGELETQARAAIFPTFSASATFLAQQQPVASVSKQQNTVKATATQPLFRGFREFALLRSRQASTEAERAAYSDAARLLFTEVADAFYTTLALQSDLRNYGDELELNRRRLKELEDYRRVGRSRASEVLSQRSNIAALEAQMEDTLGDLKTQREALAFLTGKPADTALRDGENGPSAAERLEFYLPGVGSRPDLAAAAAAARAADEAVGVAKGLHFPYADLTGNYYFSRPGSSADVKWDLAFTITLPLFQGGAVQSQVREAVSVREQAALRESRARRVADLEVKRLFEQVEKGSARLSKLNELAELSRKNHEAQRRDYANGLVTNLEVLQATSAWQVALRNLERQQLALKNDFVKLQAAAGERGELLAVAPKK